MWGGSGQWPADKTNSDFFVLGEAFVHTHQHGQKVQPRPPQLPKDGQQCRQKLGARGLLCGPTRSRVRAGRVDRRGVQGQCSCSLAWWVSSPSHQAKGFGFWWEECANMASDPQGFSKELLLRVSQNRQVTFCQRKFPPTLAGDQKAHTLRGCPRAEQDSLRFHFVKEAL